MAHDYAEHVQDQRRQKEQYFAESPRSPIPPAQQEDFPGLEYYPVDEDLRFELPLDEHDEKESLVVETTTGNEREYLRWGEFNFEVDGTTLTLQAYKGDPDEDRLWVPFRDETNGEETYGAGRYLDLEPDHHRVEDDGWVLDFNQAYNPTCAYNEAYECPLIPTENWLDVRIEAGEKDYPGDPHAGHDHGH
ncbi:MAG: DUF1684 domain-containing protein [Halodesulfurarchaeum sp.]